MMNNLSEFVHLRTHSEYSISDSIIRVSKLVELAKQNNMQALALTDLHNMFATLKFYKYCIACGIKPIIGCEVNVIDDSNFTYRVIILAKNIAGYRVLCEFISRSYIENKIGDIPYINEEWLFNKVIDDIIVLSGGMYGDIWKLLENGAYEFAIAKAKKWQAHFNDNYYLEIQRYRSDSTHIFQDIINIAANIKIPVVATHLIYFPTQDDFEAHEVRVCIARNEKLNDNSRKVLFSKDQYFTSITEMKDIFAKIPSAIINAVEISKRCNLEFIIGKYFLPEFHVPAGYTENDYFKEITYNGLGIRLKEIYEDENELELNKVRFIARLQLEIDTIISMGFVGYFLIVADFINWAKNNNILVGAGRGSGAGSLVAFSLRITDIEPLRYGLLFERFLNPERVSMPDFDIDFCQERREEVIEYVKNKYGAEAVAQIATFGTMSSKAVIKDVGRVLGLPYGLCDSLSKLILNSPVKSYSLEEAYNKFPELKEKIDSEDADIKKLWKLSLQLEDLVRNVGKHAAGVLIAPNKLTNFCPIYIADGLQTSQFDKDDVESVGLVKFDFLGLRNLTIIEECLDNIKKFYNQSIVLSNYDFNDASVYKLLQAGNTKAIFQLESEGLTRILVKLKPNSFEDIIALNALYRPGPLGSGMVDDFIRRKNGISASEYFHEDLLDCLKETYGVIVYQEQVMQISQIIGGYTLGSADLLRRAMGKKKPEEMAKHRETFINGAIKNGYNKELAEYLFDLMANFAEYGFNKSHSAAYAVISYHTAYLKSHYMSCFMSATLSSELDKTDKLYELYQDCKDNKLIILAPDINSSNYRFEPISDTTISYALGALKGIGASVVASIIKARVEKPFSSFVDFCERVDKKVLNKKVVESLVKSGAFDKLDTNRAKLFNNISKVLEFVDFEKQNINQCTLFDFDTENHGFELVKYKKWSLKEQLQMERQAIGFYFSASLFDEYKDVVKKLNLVKLNQLQNIDDNINEVVVHSHDKGFIIAGVINSIITKIVKNGARMAFIKIEDDVSQLECVVFPETYEKYSTILKMDDLIFIEGELSFDNYRNKYKVIANAFYTINQVLVKLVQKISLKIDDTFDIDVIDSFISDQGAVIYVDYINERGTCNLQLSEKNLFLLTYENLQKLNNYTGLYCWHLN